MKNNIIEINDVTIRFNMSHENVNSIKEYLIHMLKGKLKRNEFYALKNVNLSVKAGESWGIIGANGAGKSTLLKMICGVLKPYQGNIKVNGIIAPMIELGAGFDPELTAKENIYMNGALLGFSKAFIQDHYDSIVEFAELSEFMDVPLKNFSSGMYARLGFSLNTIIKPDILIVDEVFAVGDYSFQQKCKEKMKNMLAEGTTLLFVSHSIDEVKRLCEKAIWLDKGKVVAKGDCIKISERYMSSLNSI
jgi:lipopolysaccharide transport system ATP-binding protein